MDASATSTQQLLAVCLGAVGSFMMLLAFFLLNFQRDLGRFGLREDTWTYNALNFVGGALAASSAVITGEIGSYPLAALEGAWSLVGLVGLARLVLKRLRKHEAREQAALDAAAGT